MHGRIAAVLILVCAGALAGAQETDPLTDIRVDHAPSRSDPPVLVVNPRVALSGVEAAITLRATGSLAGDEIVYRVRDAAGATVAEGTLTTDGAAEVRIRPTRKAGAFTVHCAGYAGSISFRLRVIPGWLSMLPPLLAILLALLFRQVVPALLAGIWVGAWIGFASPFEGLLRTVDRYLVGALADRDHISIVIFSMLLGGMVGVVSRAGGTRGLVDSLARRATDSKRGQFFTWLLGLLVFFDDYANTLVVGNTMRPVTDRLRISREKLAYIVDSTAAPVASVALISTWIGFEVSLIDDALADVGSTQDAYWIFLQTIPYCFYPILALAMVLTVALTGRDFGAMLRAERRAAGGKLMADTAVPLADFDHPSLAPVEGKPRRWLNAVAPVVVVLIVTFVSQFLLGRASLAEAGDRLAETSLTGLGLRGFGRVFTEGDSFRALLYGAVAGCVVAIALARLQGILSVGDALRSWIEGMRTMFLAFVILTLAWAIGEVCRDVHTADYVVTVLSGKLDPRLLPLLIFFFSAVIAFSTGSSWSTMSILVPLAVPSAFTVAADAGFDPAAVHHVLLGAISSVLAGAIFGDHCSPISDTTIMSSMASGCDHVDHVRTQLPYAVLAGLVAMLLGSVPAGFGLSPWISIALGVGVVWAAVRFLGRAPGGPS